ncbi:MAG TPA: sigma-70 family RNA polymerase sigma factor [Gemmata sp.]|nr:sigma-70 family RNA polymerase sigma factor [Gemmata sp.]
MNATLARISRLAIDLAVDTDAQLLDAYLAGNDGAFRELVRRHGSLVLGVCNRILRHRQDAEDAFQAVFLVLARRARDVWPRDALGSWLYGVARRVALKARTLRSRRLSREQVLKTDVPISTESAEPDLAEVIERVIAKLPEAYRAAVVACDLEGLSRKDAAEQLGWKEGTLSGRLARARNLIARRLRNVGLAVPAAGAAGLLGTNTMVRAALAERVIDLVTTNSAGAVPAPVAVLTEGVVGGMFAFNLKAIAAVVFVVCGLGYGAWAAGDADGPPASSGDRPTLVAANQASAKAKPAPQKPTEAIAPGLQLLQGRWRIVSIAEGKRTTEAGKEDLGEIEIAGNTLWMPYRDSTGTRKREEYRIGVDDSKPLKQIDFITPNKAIARGIYELTAPAMACAVCHKTEDLGVTPQTANFLGLCPPGLKQFERYRGIVEGPRKAADMAWFFSAPKPPSCGLRLAIATAGPRPTRFMSGAEGVLEFTLERLADRVMTENESRAKDIARLEAFIKLMNQDKQSLRTAELELAQLRYEQAKADEVHARDLINVSTAEVEKAQAQLVIARQQYLLAKERLAAASERFADLKAQKLPATLPKAGDAVFTIHIRPLNAAEKTIRVKATGNETVLDGLANAAGDMAIMPDDLTVWIARDKSILFVDLAGITQRGETKTNYVLKAGDQLFVQVKVVK